MNELEQLVQRRGGSATTRFDRYQRAGLVGQSLENPSSGWNQIAGSKISNFVYCDYLGLSRHPDVIRSACLGARQAGLTTGMPRLLARDSLSQLLEAKLAGLVQQEKAILFSSTTHAVLDLLPLLSGRTGVIFVDARAYSISRKGAYAAAQGGAIVTSFAHNDPGALERALRAYRHVDDKVIVCDGVYAAGGEKAALKEFSILAERYGAVMYIDDAHGFGVLGSNPQVNPPYGSGGGGTALFEKIPAGNYAYVASLSKAFGVPVAFVAGPADFIEYLSRAADSFLHTSQPALPIVAAAIGALAVNEGDGRLLRRVLSRRVQQWIYGFQQLGMSIVDNGCFPIQSMFYRSKPNAWRLATYLRKHGVWALYQEHPQDFPAGAAIRFIISATHTVEEIHRVHELVDVLYARKSTSPGVTTRKSPKVESFTAS